MPWTVETLDVTVDDEIAALPISLQARLIRLFEMVEHLGLERIREPHAKHLRGKLWEFGAKVSRRNRERHLRRRYRPAGGRPSCLREEIAEDPARGTGYRGR